MVRVSRNSLQQFHSNDRQGILDPQWQWSERWLMLDDSAFMSRVWSQDNRLRTGEQLRSMPSRKVCQTVVSSISTNAARVKAPV